MSSTIKGQIVAMGGGGFSMEPENPLLDDFILSLSDKISPKVCFVPTAAADAASYLVRFYRAFSLKKAIPTDLTLFDPGSLPRRPSLSSKIAEFIEEQDIIYVSGGNTANQLAMWRSHGIDKVLTEAWRNGKILCGLSAGMICWFRASVTDSFGHLDQLNDGLGLIDASACPHFDGEPERRPTYHNFIQNGLLGGFAADDGAALHFRGQELVEVVSSRPNASAYRVDYIDGKVVEKRLKTRYLGKFLSDNIE